MSKMSFHIKKKINEKRGHTEVTFLSVLFFGIIECFCLLSVLFSGCVSVTVSECYCLFLVFDVFDVSVCIQV